MVRREIPKHENEFFATFAVDHLKFFEMNDTNLVVTADQKAQWLQDRQGVFVGDTLANKFGWKVGDKISLTSAIYPLDKLASDFVPRARSEHRLHRRD